MKALAQPYYDFNVTCLKTNGPIFIIISNVTDALPKGIYVKLYLK
jgi:hypothetical protein